MVISRHLMQAKFLFPHGGRSDFRAGMAVIQVEQNSTSNSYMVCHLADKRRLVVENMF